MTARDDYPVLAGFDYCAKALDEIDRLRTLDGELRALGFDPVAPLAPQIEKLTGTFWGPESPGYDEMGQ